EARQPRSRAVHGCLPCQREPLEAVVAPAAVLLHPGGADPVTDLSAVHAGTDLDDLPDDFVARRLGVDVAACALSGPHVGVAHARCVDLDEHLAGLGGGHRDFLDLPGLVVSGHDDCLHGITPSLVGEQSVPTTIGN